MELDQQVASPAKIFVIDDSPTGLAAARAILEDAGYTVFAFDTPLGVTREMARQRPDLLLVDVNMPALSGDKLCKLIRSLGSTRHTLVLLYSSKSVKELRELAASCGADGFVRKSPDPEELLSAIREHITRAMRHRAGQPPGSGA